MKLELCLNGAGDRGKDRSEVFDHLLKRTFDAIVFSILAIAS